MKKYADLRFKRLSRPEGSVLVLCAAVSICTLWTDRAAAQPAETNRAQADRNEEVPQTNEDSTTKVNWAERLQPEVIRADVEQFRGLLKSKWLVPPPEGADFDAALDGLAKRAAAGMTRSEFLIELQKILALGQDGHAVMTGWVGVLDSFGTDQGFPNFLIDICGDNYIAYRVEHLPEGPVNPRRRYQFQLLREGFPYVSAIDGVPMEKWIARISRFVPRGPELSVRWRCMEYLQYLPFWRQQLGLPQSRQIKLQLTSTDKTERVEFDAPVGKYPLFHYKIPQPDWKIIDETYGYLWIRNPASGGSKVILEAMPRLRDTQGLIIDLRGNIGGAGLETLQLTACHLLPPDAPRRVVGGELHWVDDKQRLTNHSFTADDARVSQSGREAIAAYRRNFKPPRNPPVTQPTQWRYVLLARPEAEPGIYPFNVEQFPRDQIYYYRHPVVVLMDHRNFSAGELFLAGIRELDNVTLVGSPTTAAGGASPEFFTLERSGLKFLLGSSYAFATSEGGFIDGRGIAPDIVVQPDVDYYLGRRDRMLETAIDVLKTKIKR